MAWHALVVHKGVHDAMRTTEQSRVNASPYRDRASQHSTAHKSTYIHILHIHHNNLKFIFLLLFLLFFHN